jgi:hypothetical protein
MTNETNPTQARKMICPVWQEESKINFNTYNSLADKTEQKKFEDFIGDLERRLTGSEEITVINGGHYIPSVYAPKEIGKNALETWNISCYAAKRLQDKEIDARVSLMINDLPLSAEERQNVSYEIPEEFKKVAESYGVKIMNCSTDQERPYSEKRCSNRFSQMEHQKCWQKYPIEMKEHCINAIIFYLRDIKKQGAKHSVWIPPKCSHKNMIKALQLYTKYEGGVENDCYFETNNCFE